MNYQAVIFDFDGVLSDSFPAVHEAYRSVGDELNFSVPGSLDEFRAAYLKGYHAFYRAAGLDMQLTDQANDMFHEKILGRTIPPFPGIESVLREAGQWFSLFLVSANYQKNIEKHLESYRAAEYFTLIVGRAEGAAEMDKAVAFRKLMEEYRLEPDQVIAVGDRVSDYRDAVRSGIKQAIMADYGWGYDPGDLPAEVPRAASPEELLDLLRQLAPRF